MRHATPDDLRQVDGLLDQLRTFPLLRERKPGYFSLGSRAFMHFHEDSGDIYVDVKLSGAFERMRVTTAAEQRRFLSSVRQNLERSRVEGAPPH